jgi:L-proline amide hydrolase
LWVPELFVDEFHAVRAALGIDEYHLLGQSWGGMLGAEIAVRRPRSTAMRPREPSPTAST